MRRLFVKQEAIRDGKVYLTGAEEVYYISVVLRMGAGDGLLISDSAGKVYETRILETGKDRIVLDIYGERPFAGDSGARITLYQGLPKGAKMDDVVRKATELGVFRIAPVLTARSIPNHDGGAPAAKLGRWRRIAEEAARQSQRALIPEVADVMGFSDAAAELDGEEYDLVLAFYELEERRTLKDALREKFCGADNDSADPGRGGEYVTADGEFHRADNDGAPWRDRECGEDTDHENRSPKIAAFVGPEGGFEREEIDCLVANGAVAVTIGDMILRTETAGMAVLAMIHYELEL